MADRNWVICRDVGSNVLRLGGRLMRRGRRNSLESSVACQEEGVVANGKWPADRARISSVGGVHEFVGAESVLHESMRRREVRQEATSLVLVAPSAITARHRREDHT